METTKQQLWGMLFALLLGSSIPAFSQQKEEVFRSSELSHVAQKLLGDSTAVPLLLTLAHHDVTRNVFILTPQARRRANEFAVLHRSVQNCKVRMGNAVRSGAKVFVPQLVDSLEASLRRYQTAIAGGEVHTTFALGEEIQRRTTEVERTLEQRRTETVDALLAKKDGTVHKRKGFLGQWQTATIGDLFVAYDGVRTYEKSTALVSFTDRVDVVVDPNTTIIIRESVKDKLWQTKRKDIALVQGSVLARMEEKAKEENDFRLQTEGAEASVKSGKFWAQVEKKSRLANYDGTIDVAAQNVRVTLERNEGTIVEKGKLPLKPIPLLPAPVLAWQRTDSVIYRDSILLSWKPVSGAQRYEVELSTSKTFDEAVRRVSVQETKALLRRLPLGVTYVRVYAFDVHGLRGVDSPVLTVIRTEDTQPPALNFEDWESDIRYTARTELLLNGQTETQAQVRINNTAVPLNPDGTFAISLRVHAPETKFRISATDLSGNTTSRVLTIIPIDTLKLFDLRWSCPATKSTVKSGGKLCEVHGTSYPTMRVIARYGDRTQAVTTNVKGEWALVLDPAVGDTLTLQFESLADEQIVATRQWRIE